MQISGDKVLCKTTLCIHLHVYLLFKVTLMDSQTCTLHCTVVQAYLSARNTTSSGSLLVISSSSLAINSSLVVRPEFVEEERKNESYSCVHDHPLSPNFHAALVSKVSA